MTVFDPVKYKATTRDQWEHAAEAWHRWGPTLHAWLGPATERMLDLAGVGAGMRILDIAAGAGEQTIAIAERVGPDGEVLATDISPAILEYAAAEARRAGLRQIRTAVMDGEAVDVPGGTYDAVLSRVGLIYLPDRQRALTGMLQALRPGGRVGAIVYSTAEANAFFATPVSIVRRRAGLGPPLPGQPGPFGFGPPGVLEEAYRAAGFVEVKVETVPAPLRLPSAAECVRFERESFGALHQMMGGLDEAAREAAWTEIRDALAAYEGPNGFVGPCELRIAVGTRPE